MCLDYWLFSTETQDDVITLSLSGLDRQPFGPSYWKFNSNLLDDASYKDLISSKYPDWLANYDKVKDKLVLWDNNNNTNLFNHVIV